MHEDGGKFLVPAGPGTPPEGGDYALSKRRIVPAENKMPPTPLKSDHRKRTHTQK